MKIRNGFVSNSSSSSFVIILKKNGEELTTEKLMKAFDVSEKSALYRMALSLAHEMITSCEEYTSEKYKENYVFDDDDNSFKEDYPTEYKIYEKVKNNNWKIYYGSADDCDQPTLCELTLDYEDDEIKIEKEGGY